MPTVGSIILKWAKVEVLSANGVEDCIRLAIEYSQANYAPGFMETSPLVSFEFNGVTISVFHDSDPEEVYKTYIRTLHEADELARP